jgi:dTDP-4-dehydrorhamnose reductase
LKVLVTGARGLLGTDVTRAARSASHEVVPLGREELDVTDAAAVSRALERERPAAVVNCAAYTNVDGAEDDLRGAMDVNADGAEAVARAAEQVGASVVYPSTDYVFDGSKLEPYVESDEPRPESVYAQSKLAGERVTAGAGPRHFVVRSAWLFGVAGANFVATMLRLGSEHGEVVVVRDQVGSPTYAGHLADAIVRLLGTEDHGVHHLAGGGECSWYELAAEALNRARVECRVLSCTTEQLGRAAPRPRYSVLASERPDAIVLPHWREGIAAYLADAKALA